MQRFSSGRFCTNNYTDKLSSTARRKTVSVLNFSSAHLLVQVIII